VPATSPTPLEGTWGAAPVQTAADTEADPST